MQTSPAIFRLTVLWALNESALGGIMHALKIPFTGFFVGGFAVVCTGLIAFYSNFSFKQILQATFLVLLVKSTVSPQSPVAAYFAVAFQGFFGAIIFCTVKNFTTASLLFGFIAMIESALQKFILLTILFGKSLWQALDIFVMDVLKLFSLQSDFSFSYWLVVSYTIVYALWGVLLGWWISKLPVQIQTRAHAIVDQLKPFVFSNQIDKTGLEKKKRTTLYFLFAVLVLMIAVLLLNVHSSHKIILVIIRTLAAMFIVFYIITPLVKWLLQKSSAKNKAAITSLVEQLPHMQKLISPSWKLASQNFTGIRKYKEFIFILIVAALNFEVIEQ